MKLPLSLCAILFVSASSARETENKSAATQEKVRSFFNSEGYKKLHKSDEDFVRDLYHIVLEREVDEPGFKNWLAALKKSGDPQAREKALEAFFKSPEYVGKHSPAPPSAPSKDTTRNPANILFDKTGVFVNSASALPPDRYASYLKKGGVVWITLQIDNGGAVREDNVESINKGWMKSWQAAGFNVGFWGCPRGITQHTNLAVVADSTKLVETDASLAVHLTAKYNGEFYIADCEDGFQGYNPADPTPVLNRVYIEAFQKAAVAAGIAKIPRAVSSMGRVALDMKPWIDAGWDAMPQAYWNSYAVYQPSKCVDFYVNEGGWPIGRVHPTIATYSGEGENRSVTLREYEQDLAKRKTTGFSYYLPESYLRFDESAYEQLARMAKP